MKMQERTKIYDDAQVKDMRMGLSELAHYRDSELIASLWGGFQDIKTRELYIAFDAFGVPDLMVGDVVKVFSSFLQVTGLTQKADYLVVSTVKTTEPVQNSLTALLARVDQHVTLVEAQVPALRALVTFLAEVVTQGQPLTPGALTTYAEALAQHADVATAVRALLYQYLVND